jgi:hypothetical protein
VTTKSSGSSRERHSFAFAGLRVGEDQVAAKLNRKPASIGDAVRRSRAQVRPDWRCEAPERRRLMPARAIGGADGEGERPLGHQGRPGGGERSGLNTSGKRQSRAAIAERSCARRASTGPASRSATSIATQGITHSGGRLARIALLDSPTNPPSVMPGFAAVKTVRQRMGARATAARGSPGCR